MTRSLLVFTSLFCAAIVAAAPKPGDFLTSGPAKDKRIALTFDDGPGPNTEKFLDLLRRCNVKGTFFVLGEQAKRRPNVTRRIAAEGHELASHTMTHMNYAKRFKFHFEKTGNDALQAAAATKKELVDDMRASRTIFEKEGGASLKLLRMPHGVDRPWIKDAAKETGSVLVNWTFGSDWDKAPAEKQIPAYAAAIKPGAVILLHDGWPKSDKSLAITEAVIKTAREKGFEMVTLGELLGVGKGQ